MPPRKKACSLVHEEGYGETAGLPRPHPAQHVDARAGGQKAGDDTDDEVEHEALWHAKAHLCALHSQLSRLESSNTALRGRMRRQGAGLSVADHHLALLLSSRVALSRTAQRLWRAEDQIQASLASVPPPHAWDARVTDHLRRIGSDHHRFLLLSGAADMGDALDAVSRHGKAHAAFGRLQTLVATFSEVTAFLLRANPTAVLQNVARDLRTGERIEMPGIGWYTDLVSSVPARLRQGFHPEPTLPLTLRLFHARMKALQADKEDLCQQLALLTSDAWRPGEQRAPKDMDSGEEGCEGWNLDQSETEEDDCLSNTSNSVVQPVRRYPRPREPYTSKVRAASGTSGMQSEATWDVAGVDDVLRALDDNFFQNMGERILLFKVLQSEVGDLATAWVLIRGMPYLTDIPTLAQLFSQLFFSKKPEHGHQRQQQ